MFFTQFNGWRMDGTGAVTQKCLNCSNTTDHFVAAIPKGFQAGVIFSKKSLLGARAYYLTCPTCGVFDGLNADHSRVLR